MFALTIPVAALLPVVQMSAAVMAAEGPVEPVPQERRATPPSPVRARHPVTYVMITAEHSSRAAVFADSTARALMTAAMQMETRTVQTVQAPPVRLATRNA